MSAEANRCGICGKSFPFGLKYQFTMQGKFYLYTVKKNTYFAQLAQMMS